LMLVAFLLLPEKDIEEASFTSLCLLQVHISLASMQQSIHSKQKILKEV